jgi:sugar transferase EpsL
VPFSLFPGGIAKSKRLIDLFISLVAIVILSPVYLLITILLLLFDGLPVLYQQERPGYKGRLFKIYKFRTMRDSRDEHGHLLPEENRLFPFGRFLRHTSLDELPELFNILRGEMSWVGPRPLLVEYLPLYTPEQNHRHDALPGLTGWAQVNGRNAITWEQKFKLDVWYVNHRSLWLDSKILFLSLWKIIKGEGISPQSGEIMEKFTGNRKSR